MALVGKAPSAIAGPLEGLAYLRIDDIWMSVNPNGWENPLGAELTFQFIDLEQGLQESASANYASIDVIGRAESYQVYMGVQNKQIPLTFKFQVQGSDPSKSLSDSLIWEVRHPALWLDALKYPYIAPDGLSHAPPPCVLKLGQLFSGLVIAADVQINWQSPFDPDTLLPYGAEVICQFTVVRRFITNYPINNTWGP